MTTAATLSPPPTRTPMVALVGNPNAGKTSLFNALTGSRQKVGNYPGVTVERKTGVLALADGSTAELIDLPGTYSLTPRSPDEAVTRAVVMGQQDGSARPDAIIAVVDATNLRNHLRFVLEIKALGLPMLVVINMVDLAERDGTEIDYAALEKALGIAVIPAVAVRRKGMQDIIARLNTLLAQAPAQTLAPQPSDLRSLQKQAQILAQKVTLKEGNARRSARTIDAVALHPVAGPIVLAAILFIIFQAVFSWAEMPMTLIETLLTSLQNQTPHWISQGWLLSLINDGVIAGVGAVVVFLPQILILFFFILLLEQSGYMVRAAFLMDRIMARAGLNGRAFIPLLSSFACAVPGIMATRTIDEPRDRLTTILIAPLMTCSARLPVYAVIIAAFIPDQGVGPFNLQGLVLFCLYAVGVVGAFGAALLLRRTITKGAGQIFLMEMPQYQWPALRDILIGVYQRALSFLQRAGTIILASTVILWVLASYPKPPAEWKGTALEYSAAGRIGHGLAYIFKPIGFNEAISLALVPGMAAREIAVSALGTVYALEGDEGAVEKSLVERLRSAWELPTALAFLAWFVFAPQCISTIAIVRRETNGWKWPAFMVGYLFLLAYIAAGLTYWGARALL